MEEISKIYNSSELLLKFLEYIGQIQFTHPTFGPNYRRQQYFRLCGHAY